MNIRNGILLLSVICLTVTLSPIFFGSCKTTEYSEPLSSEHGSHLQITILSPANNSYVKGSVVIRGGARCDTDNTTIERMEISINGGDWHLAAGTISWSYLWNTTHVPDGLYSIQVRAFAGTDTKSTGVVVTVANNMPTLPTGKLSGTVKSDWNDAPVHSANVELVGADISCYTDANGYYEMTIVCGDYQVLFTATGYRDSYYSPVFIRQNMDLEMDCVLETIRGNLSGNINDFATGEPISGAIVRILELNMTCVSDTDGNYQFDDIPIGHYTIILYKPGYSQFTTSIGTMQHTTFCNITLSCERSTSSEMDMSMWKRNSVMLFSIASLLLVIPLGYALLIKTKNMCIHISSPQDGKNTGFNAPLSSPPVPIAVTVPVVKRKKERNAVNSTSQILLELIRERPDSTPEWLSRSLGIDTRVLIRMATELEREGKINVNRDSAGNILSCGPKH